MRRNMPLNGIKRITVSGYKSLAQEQSIDINPLTLLAGVNSSGKSSVIQPLLLLKQTLDATYDPGALLLNGPNVKFTSFEQLLSRKGNKRQGDSFQIGIDAMSIQERYGSTPEGDFEEYKTALTTSVKIRFGKRLGSGFDIQEMDYCDDDEIEKIDLRRGMSEEEIVDVLPEGIRASVIKELRKNANGQHKYPGGSQLAIVRERCFLKVEATSSSDIYFDLPHFFSLPPAGALFTPILTEIIHLPGLRGNAERTYPMTAIGKTYPGTFENYTASIIANWQSEGNAKTIGQLSMDLRKLGLTSGVEAKQVNDTQVELQVGRLVRFGRRAGNDLVNIADVGVGVSQALPVLVALQVAQPGQLVYIEQPEIHLHPRAQTAMAQVLADAAMRGVRIVAETHSSLLLLGIQTLVAEGKLPPELVKLHWFSRDKGGETTIRSADLDDSGAFGDWPEDFADVALEAESRYLDAAEDRQHIH